MKGQGDILQRCHTLTGSDDQQWRGRDLGSGLTGLWVDIQMRGSSRAGAEQWKLAGPSQLSATQNTLKGHKMNQTRLFDFLAAVTAALFKDKCEGQLSWNSKILSLDKTTRLNKTPAAQWECPVSDKDVDGGVRICK